MDEDCDTPRAGLTTDIWVGTFQDLAEQAKEGSALEEVAEMAMNILDLCGETPLLIEYLNSKTLDVMEWRDQRGSV